MLVLAFGMGAFGSVQFWLSLYLQIVENLSALEVAVHMLPQVIGAIVVNVSIQDFEQCPTARPASTACNEIWADILVDHCRLDHA
jgi:hypothetical protein